jgi:hypothetical protein
MSRSAAMGLVPALEVPREVDRCSLAVNLQDFVGHMDWDKREPADAAADAAAAQGLAHALRIAHQAAEVRRRDKSRREEQLKASTVTALDVIVAVAVLGRT